MEQSKKRDHKIMITTIAVDRVNIVRLSDMSESSALKIQQLHKKVLYTAMKENYSNEVLLMTNINDTAAKSTLFKIIRQNIQNHQQIQ